ncbi:MAG TPA: hypothetical protein VFY06_09505 [Verrucomicrobiae bacterium]|nr:hypothetical protein [Verrucomicrobiae bacterium]
MADFINRNSFSTVNVADRFIQRTQQTLFILRRQFWFGLGIEPKLQSFALIARQVSNGLLNFNQRAHGAMIRALGMKCKLTLAIEIGWNITPSHGQCCSTKRRATR